MPTSQVTCLRPYKQVGLVRYDSSIFRSIPDLCPEEWLFRDSVRGNGVVLRLYHDSGIMFLKVRSKNIYLELIVKSLDNVTVSIQEAVNNTTKEYQQDSHRPSQE